MSEEEQDQRHIYKKILEYEQDAVSTSATPLAPLAGTVWGKGPSQALASTAPAHSAASECLRRWNAAAGVLCALKKMQ